MDAMGLSNKKPSTVSTSHSGSFTPNNPDLAKAAGIVSVPRLALTHPPPQGPWCSHCPAVHVLTLGTGLGVDTVLRGRVP